MEKVVFFSFLFFSILDECEVQLYARILIGLCLQSNMPRPRMGKCNSIYILMAGEFPNVRVVQGWHHVVFYSWDFRGFFKKKTPNHMRSSKILFYSLSLKISWDYRVEGPTPSWNIYDGNWNKTMVLFAEIGFFTLNQKLNASTWKSWVFPTLPIVRLLSDSKASPPFLNVIFPILYWCIWER